MLVYLTVINLSLLISCLINLFGADIFILLSKNIAKKNTETNKITLITNLLFVMPLLVFRCNLSCIIIKLYLNLQIKTKLWKIKFKIFRSVVKKNLVLLGMMAVGKTTLGKIVAKRQGLEFIDTDKNIEKKNSMTISEIFKKKGE